MFTFVRSGLKCKFTSPFDFWKFVLEIARSFHLPILVFLLCFEITHILKHEWFGLQIHPYCLHKASSWSIFNIVPCESKDARIINYHNKNKKEQMLVLQHDEFFFKSCEQTVLWLHVIFFDGSEGGKNTINRKQLWFCHENKSMKWNN